MEIFELMDKADDGLVKSNEKYFYKDSCLELWETVRPSSFPC